MVEQWAFEYGLPFFDTHCITQPKISFQFLICKESSYMVFTTTYHYFFF